MNLECSCHMEVRSRKIQLTVTTAVGRVYNAEMRRQKVARVNITTIFN